MGAVLSILLGLCFLIPPLGRELVNLSYDLAFLFRSKIQVQDVVIVYMDLDSHTRLGQQDRFQRWDRKLHARLIDLLTGLQVKAVVFDVLFVPVNNDPEADAEFVRAVKRNGKVVVGAMVAPKVLEGQVIGGELNPPFPELEAVAHWGLVEVAFADPFVRKQYQRKDLDAPSMAWRAAQLTLTNALPEPFQERWINYYGPPGMLAHYSYWEALEMTNRGPANPFFNKVVFVGALYHVGMTGGKGTDDYRTPYSRWTGTKSPGVEINATAYLNLARGDWLERTSLLAEFALLILCGATFGFGLSLLSPMKAAGMGLLGAILIGLVAIVLVWKVHIWFPWLILSSVQVPCAMAWSVLAHTRRLTREKRALEQTIALASASEQAAAQLQASSPAGDLAASAANIKETEVFSVPDHTLLRRIGEGAYGEVWLARDIIGSYHAVKIVRRRNFADVAPFEREFNGIRRFTPISMGHPGLVHVLHVGRNEKAEYIYYVMELAEDEVSGQTIDPQTYSPRNLAKDLKRSSPLPLAQCIAICLQLADALHYLHEHHLIHRDIKPSNIIFVKGSPKLADIGLVTEAAADGKDVSYLGTEGYIPPEGPGTPLADIYSLGKVMYEAATGLNVRRFPELPTALMQEAVDEALLELNTIIMKACAPDPKRRYDSALALHSALSSVQDALKSRGAAKSS